MEISNAVAHKIRGDKELLTLLKSAQPNHQINRGILLTLDIPRIPREHSSQEEKDAFDARFEEVVNQADQGLGGIDGLKIYNLMKAIGHASVGGTAEALVKALELDCVKSGLIGDRPIFRGASVG